MLKYGTFCRKCRKNRNIRAMRKWFWIKSGCEEAPQVVPACVGVCLGLVKMARLTRLCEYLTCRQWQTPPTLTKLNEGTTKVVRTFGENTGSCFLNNSKSQQVKV